jgi:hypothetical protein
MIVVGGLLILGPVLSSRTQKARIAQFYEKNGNGALLPREMAAHDAFDWMCLFGGAFLTLAGIKQAGRLPDKPPS